MDFIGLPKSGDKNYILVVIDMFTKYCHLIPLLHPFTTSMLARKFFNTVLRLHGCTSTIVFYSYSFSQSLLERVV